MSTMKSFKDLNIAPRLKGFSGPKIDVDGVMDQTIVVQDFKVVPSKFPDKSPCLHLQLEMEGRQRVLFVSSKTLIDILEQVPKDAFPFTATIIRKDKRLEFK